MENKKKISGLKYLARQYSRSLTPDQEIETENITELFWADLKKGFETGELINIQILGDVASSKSTTAGTIITEIRTWLGKRMKTSAICADQMEYTQKIMDETIKNTAYVIDEWNILSAQTGLSSTTDNAYLRYSQDVMAQRYIHIVSCSPATITDPNARIMLWFMAKDTNTEESDFLITYKLLTAQGTINQLIGHIKINVGNTIKQKWYKEYRKKKFKRMELLNKHGIVDKRDMQTAQMARETYIRLRTSAKRRMQDRAMIKLEAKAVKRENKYLMSWIGVEEVIDDISAMLKLETLIYSSIRKQEILKEKAGQEKTRIIQQRINELEEDINEMRKRTTQQLKRWDKLIKIYDEYLTIGVEKE